MTTSPDRASKPAPCRSLADIPQGQRATICAHPLDAAVPTRLRELGFVPGTALHVIRRAPLGDPIEVELRGYRLCLRRTELRTLCAVPTSPTG